MTMSLLEIHARERQRNSTTSDGIKGQICHKMFISETYFRVTCIAAMWFKVYCNLKQHFCVAFCSTAPRRPCLVMHCIKRTRTGTLVSK